MLSILSQWHITRLSCNNTLTFQLFDGIKAGFNEGFRVRVNSIPISIRHFGIFSTKVPTDNQSGIYTFYNTVQLYMYVKMKISPLS